jgi:PIN domain nuclease of toxin-antitoxin system
MKHVPALQVRLGMKHKTVMQQVAITVHREILILHQQMFAARPEQHGMQLANSACVMLKTNITTHMVFTAKQTIAHINNIMCRAATLAQ